MRIYLASTTSGMTKEDRMKAFQDGKPLYCLETFFNGETICKQVLNDVGVDNFLLDSGAFSYMSGAKCTKKDLIEYMDRYIDFINKHDIKYFFELDVDTIFGIEFVESLRKKLESKTNKKCIPVWHKGRGIEYWKKMCREYNYVAIGGLVFHVKKKEYELIKKMVDYAYSHGVKVHGLGFTKTKDLPEYKFYSVDSASWIKAAALGQRIHKFNIKGGYILSKKINGNNKKIKLSKLVAHNFIEWCKFQKYMNNRRW